MDAVTYPNPKVIDFLQNKVVPLQLRSDAQPYAADYCIKWTPSLLIIDGEGKEHYRTTGFFSAVDLLPSLMLGIGKGCFDNDLFNEAIECFDNLIAEYSYSCSAPEAVFFRGVALYKSTHQVKHLKQMYRTLQDDYPNSAWAKRAYPYWLIP
ncbi:MAG: hypothetical protein AB9866_28825 [Syntrophobacteraceae bacterium]